MIVIYTPQGGEPEHYDARTLLVSEASIVSRTIDKKWGEIKTGLEQEDLDAMRGVVWVLKKRTQPALRWGEFDPGVEDMVARMDDKEIRAWLEGALTIRAQEPEITDEEFAAVAERMVQQAADPDRAREVLAELIEEAKGKEAGPAPQQEAAESSSPTPTSTEPDSSTSVSSLTSSTSLLLSSTS
ncbi:hypothetical protein [Streptomyces sp. NPDC051310]|uniref:hypothetical protein n=1 Tax=Streptomyces sp. NPDC051310 TaxID=3365649 RepID=UPI0037A0E364